MYGYIRPAGDELKVREARLYADTYCGLCHALRLRCSPLARLTVSYDLTLLALLLADGSEACCMRRCPRHPFSGKRCLRAGKGLDQAADLGMILFWHKLMDARNDEKGAKRLAAGLSMLFLRRGYRKAAEREAEYDAFAGACLAELAVLEKENCPSLDRTADCFARLLAACGKSDDPVREQANRELLYHVGRCIYIMDAADDRAADEKSGSYNPLLLRFESWDETARQRVCDTVALSAARALTALRLLPETDATPILENILREGIPAVNELVLRSEWKARRSHLRRSRKELWSDQL